nr:hypothetical protein [Mucilaginibacter pedocola]
MLHFFNPKCACSRFNIAAVKKLYRRYGSRVDFVVVVLSNEPYTAAQIQQILGLSVPVTFNKAIAADCGVYSTPQVALLNWSRKLYYYGNYNRSRYCTDEKTNYAADAIAGLLSKNARLFINPLALKAYGCSLPTCGK